jgi:UDP-glucuronate 4-epimerase
VGLDNLSDYYDVRLKEARLERLRNHTNFQFTRTDLGDRSGVEQIFADHRPQRVVHLAAQAGVRYSIENPHTYVESNVVGTLHVLEGCRAHDVDHLVLASTSSVYGANTKLPFSVEDNVDHPLSLYAATKKSGELMAHCYAHLYRLPVTGLRFFTVYGPWGRPDMALFKFTRAILAGEPIEIYNDGQHARDFTYVDDVVEGVIRALDRPAKADPAWSGERPNPATSSAPYRIYNIGNSNPVELLDLISCLERALGRTAIKRFLPLQPGDVPRTAANIGRLVTDVGYRPGTPIEVGVERFVAWYLDYHGIST